MISSKPTVFFCHLLQDLEVLVPLMKKLRDRGEPVLALVHTDAHKKYPNMLPRLKEEGLPHALFNGQRSWEWLRWGRKAKAVVTACDCNVGAHRRGHQFVRRARLLGKPTFTLQHGLENIGLNYTDDEFPAEGIRFASKYVLTWGGEETLLPEIPRRTRRKTHAVGVLRELKPVLRATSKAPVVLFENLHWERYSEDYRQAFLSDLKTVAENFPDLQFVLKPHLAGRWMTHRFKGEWARPANVTVLDPTDPKLPTAGELIADASLVITTPSTIALDSALCAVPVAVVGNDLDVGKYEPLPILRKAADWIALIQSVHEGRYPEPSLDAFVARHSVGRNGLDEAAKFIQSHS